MPLCSYAILFRLFRLITVFIGPHELPIVYVFHHTGLGFLDYLEYNNVLRPYRWTLTL